ncbi:D-alanine--D-alanine ligase family protein [Loigolactobacillus bifermentans]|uniref:D-alanine--D-alanine ligase n=1 Tax=Loigolactobacillus bifermentans DSM 20003 TaxID=1423726 RepID=A0A0R1GWI5_9LACO|nr:D-alanine--D-alanine ligase [Loigolactobacillus bifermentans]KRK36419.1 D-alanine--D-alanine ligase [Loigolactobacillus bifermentans DSM 20003]QGG60639.1 D-alanine--D-alanine ligase [Loigolactobacillus bifermentans]
MKIVVLAGGRSPERNVSLSSGAMITSALREKGHQAVLIDLFLGDALSDVQNVDDVFDRKPAPQPKQISDAILTDADIDALRTDGTKGLFGPNVIKICQAADIVFLGLHGEDGENGKVQAVLDTFSIRYTGSDTLASGMAMDKQISKEIMLFNHIKTARFVMAYQADTQRPDFDFGYPVVVKPTQGGSSIGMSFAHNDDELDAALKEAFRFDSEVLIEEFISGREFSMGVVNGVAMPAIEIKVNDGWYDFEHKFQDNKTTFVTPPADFSEAAHDEMKQIALKTFKVLKMKNYGRIDFFANDEGIYVIEVNSLPGMTPLSLLPQEAAAAGISYADLVEEIVQSKVALYEQEEA